MTSTARARRTASRARRSGGLEALTRIGFVGYALLHLAIAWLAVQIATGNYRDHADQSGAFRLLGQQPLGRALLLIIAVGLAAMALWQLLLACVGHREYRGRRRVAERVTSLGRVAIYGILLWTDIQVLHNPSTSSAASQQKATSGVLAEPAGRLLVAVAGGIVVAICLGMIWYGLSKKFASKLSLNRVQRETRRGIIALGQVGYVGRGLAFGIAGTLLFDAAVSDNAARSRGLDGALRTLAEHRFGTFLLAIIAIGFAAFGIYSFFQARYRRM